MTAEASWKTAWITGGGTGIGREVALLLAKKGVRVAISGRTAANLNEVAALHENIRAYPLDVTDADAVKAVAEAIVRDLGLIDLAILNAAVWHPMSATDYNLAEASQSMIVNYGGLINTLAAVMPGMIARKGGHLALVASVAGYRGLPKSAAYAPSKAAIISLAESLYLDLWDRGVTLSVINPGFVDTPMTKINKFPMPFIITAEDAAGRIVRGLERKHYEIAFPFPLVRILKCARRLPDPLFFWFTRRFLMPGEEKP